MDYYNKNTQYLKEFRPDLLKAIEEKKLPTNSELEAIDSIITKDGNKAIVVRYKSKEYRLNSSYKPAEEAKRWAKAYEITGINSVLSMFGLGNGEFARALINKMNDTSYLLIYEPSYDIFSHTLKNYDITDIISNEKVLLFIEGINSGDFRKISSFLTSFTNLSTQKQCIHPKYDEIFAESAVKFYKDIKDNYISEVINTNTIKKLSKRMIDNIFCNMEFLKDSSSLAELKKILPDDIPAIIVAAGPSVEENIKELKRAKGRAVIFAVDSILKYLLNAGIEPDFVVTIDPNKSIRHFTGKNPVSVPLIAYMEANHELLKLHKGKKIFCSQNEFVNEIYRNVGKIPPYIEPSGSVAIVAFNVCLHLGIKEIILVGQDLAYKDNKTHAGRNNNVEFNPHTDVMVEGIHGESIRSRYDWHEYIRGYENIISQNPDITVIDAKKFGAKIIGTKVMDLKVAIDQYCNKYYEEIFNIENIENTFRDNEIKHIREYLHINLYTLTSIKNKITKAIKDCDILIKENYNPGSKKFTDALKRIEKTNKYIETQKIYSVIDSYVVAITTDEMTQIFKITDNIDEDNINTFKQAKAIYEAAIEAIDYVYPKLEEAIAKL